MTVRAITLGAALAALCGCPLPQPLPAVQRVDGATVVPPRILTETATPQEALVSVGTACPAGSVLRFDADLEDPDLDDLVEARWFVDYAATAAGSGYVAEFPPASADGADPRRALTGYPFPVVPAPAGEAHVVELVVSNGFYPALGEPAGVALPRRTPLPGYETQTYRWFVVYEDAGPCP